MVAATGDHHQNPVWESASHGSVCVCMHASVRACVSGQRGPGTGKGGNGYGLMQGPRRNPREVRGGGIQVRPRALALWNPAWQRV